MPTSERVGRSSFSASTPEGVITRPANPVFDQLAVLEHPFRHAHGQVVVVIDLPSPSIGGCALPYRAPAGLLDNDAAQVVPGQVAIVDRESLQAYGVTQWQMLEEMADGVPVGGVQMVGNQREEGGRYP